MNILRSFFVEHLIRMANLSYIYNGFTIKQRVGIDNLFNILDVLLDLPLFILIVNYRALLTRDYK